MSSFPNPTGSSLPESIRLLQLLWKLKAALDRTSNEMEKHLGVNGPQRFLLRFIGLVPGITLAGLGEAFAVDVSNLEPDLELLVDQHLLVRQGDSPGYYLTAAGASVNATMAGTVEEAVAKAADEASPHERTSFQRMLERVVGHLKPVRSRRL